MGEKSIQKKEYIVEKARDVFARKGYRAVTMKDIVEECEISRGGLYLYFNSTKELFEAVMAREAAGEDAQISSELRDAKSATEVMTVFLKEQKKDLLKKKSTLLIATYEFYFENQVPKKENRIRRQYEGAVKVLESMIRAGVESGEFEVEDPKASAANIMMILEGLKVASCTMGITEEMINSQFLVIMQGLIKD